MRPEASRYPSATMVLLRARDEGADYLALADAMLLLDTADGLKVVTDERVNQLAGREREAANRVPTGSALKLRRRAQLTRAVRRSRSSSSWPGEQLGRRRRSPGRQSTGH